MNNFKILICEDNGKKADNMVDYLNKFFTYGVEIVVADNIMDAKEQIDDVADYNLFFIDLKMPDVFNGNYSIKAGEVILEHIKKQYQTKYEIVIITTDTVAKESFLERNPGYEVIDYSHSDKNAIEENKLKKVIEKKAKELSIPLDNKHYDIVLITALNSEMIEIRDAFDIYQKKSANAHNRKAFEWVGVNIKNDMNTYKATKIENIDGKSATVISSSINGMGLTKSSVLATKMIINFKPKIIVMLGVCAGKEGDTELGDVIVVDKSFNYQSGKSITKDGNILFKPDFDIINLNQTIRNQFADRLDTDAYHIAHEWNIKNKKDNFKNPIVYLGILGSGSAVIADDKTFLDIESHNRKIIGIDMEAYSIFVAAENITDGIHKPKAIVIKGIQDHANISKDIIVPDKNSEAPEKDKFTNFAAYASAAYFLNFCNSYLINELD